MHKLIKGAVISLFTFGLAVASCHNEEPKQEESPKNNSAANKSDDKGASTNKDGSSDAASDANNGTDATSDDNGKQNVSDTMTDAAGNSYKTVVINGLTWMAENIKYEDESAGITCDWSGYNYHEDADFKEEYGCYYKLESAKKVCPTGWHLPTEAEFQNLLSKADAYDLMAKKPAWSKSSQDGRDTYGFAALPAGSGRCQVGECALFWSSSEDSGDQVYLLIRATAYADDDIITEIVAALDVDPATYMSVRCIKD